MNYILAIDIGTTSTKVVAFDKTGRLLRKENAPYPTLSQKPHFQEQSPDEIYKSLMAAVAKVIQYFPIPPLAITFSSAMHSIIAIDKAGNPLTNSIIWSDGRSQSHADALVPTHLGRAIFLHTGTPIHAMSPLCKIKWLSDNNTFIFNTAYKFISIKEYVHYQWFKTFKIDYSIASATGLFDIRKKKWYAPALDYCGINKNQLSEFVPTNYQFDELLPEVAQQLGIPAEIPVIIGASDGCLANLGTGILDNQNLVISIGTSAAVRMTNTQPIESKTNELFNYILEEEYYVLGGASNNGGIIYEWTEKQFGLTHDIKLQAAALPAGAEKLLFLPYLNGERAPLWNAQAKGAFIGLHKAHSIPHFYRAILEGIAFNLYTISQHLIAKLTVPFKIYANGGFTQNDLAMQIIADVFHAEVHLQAHEEGTAWGAAKLGLKAIGQVESYEDFPPLETFKTFKPNADNYSSYLSYFEIWKELYTKLENSFFQLNEL